VLLATHDGERARESKAAHPSGRVEVTCEACGKVNSFQTDAVGSVQECSQCGEYLDMPGAQMPDTDYGEDEAPEGAV